MSDEETGRLGERIAEARHRAAMTQAELAATVSLERSALAKIESGSRRVSALELARIAVALDERIEWFVSPAPASVVSHRNLQEPGAKSPAIDRLVERLARHVEFALAHDERLALDTPNLARPESGRAAEKSAADARKLLGLTENAPLLDVSGHAAKAGLLVFGFDMGADAADAASILLGQGGVAVVNGGLHAGRRRLAAAHELGHYLFADAYTVDWRIAEQEGDDIWESRLDRFARALLLPPQGLTHAWTRFRRDSDLRTAAVKAGSVFRVDMSTLARRLRELNLVDATEAHQVRSVRTTKSDIVEFNLVVWEEISPSPYLPKPYIASILRLYRNATISGARATDLLMDAWNEEDLPVVDPLPDSAIWQFVS
ncbi:DNA-binding protein [Sphaerisporangium siamense]|uniref:Zn-dependent peptidase ImmA (M78 family)/DNA-binding XRE family transcriptional regulator n=1 Tax=Sphaerisporangium siamense TaxID=795645 RepID=A0A7W7GBU9_9ACTN|nr:XRE family transcriptional regulator [Sphaerisporangium siamense]MBB4701351.1 Zn-dependent peptidase ImmA (M78 family)/DNA-binding XRE family transcriptional regulator [Sphaerisporangium siamense]GII87280.1 DNA-binding protein [Sphaerisporangium siamense]